MRVSVRGFAPSDGDGDDDTEDDGETEAEGETEADGDIDGLTELEPALASLISTAIPVIGTDDGLILMSTDVSLPAKNSEYIARFGVPWKCSPICVNPEPVVPLPLFNG